MKFLFGQSADFRLIPHLRQLGHDVHVISRNYPPGLPDEDVLEIARKEQRILVVADRDFGELIFQQGLAHAGVIFFRLPGAKLQIDAARLESYKAALKEEIETSVRVEPGVLALYAVSEKDNPINIMVFEIYADENAYRAHLETPHFKKYKTNTLEMVKSLELIETVSILVGAKAK